MSFAPMLPTAERPVLGLFQPSTHEDSTELRWDGLERRGLSDNPSDTRTTNPGVEEISETLRLLQGLREADLDDSPRLTPAQVIEYRDVLPLSDFYERVIAPWRRKQLARNEVASGTLTNERQAMKCFTQFDRLARPQGWPADKPWNGWPVGLLTSKRVRDWLSYRLEHGTDQGTLSQGSLPKRWSHLRTVLNQAIRLGVLKEKISISVPQVIDAYLTSAGIVDDSDLIPTALTDQELDAVYRQLSNDIELRAAWVIGATCGPRTADLFSLRWGKSVRWSADPPDVIYLAQKTRRKRRRIWVPLGPIAVAHVKELIQHQAHTDQANPEGLLFPSLTDDQRADPEDGPRSRQRTRRIKVAMAAAGVNCVEADRPWQLLRSTCNSRLNNIERQAGDRATHGADSSVQGVFYNDYREMLMSAVRRLDERRIANGIFAAGGGIE